MFSVSGLNEMKPRARVCVGERARASVCVYVRKYNVLLFFSFVFPQYAYILINRRKHMNAFVCVCVFVCVYKEMLGIS